MKIRVAMMENSITRFRSTKCPFIYVSIAEEIILGIERLKAFTIIVTITSTPIRPLYLRSRPKRVGVCVVVAVCMMVGSCFIRKISDMCSIHVIK